MNFSNRPWTWAIALAFLVNFVVCMFVAARMPVFHHIDELAHFDYALKLARGVPLISAMPVEPDADQLWLTKIDLMNSRYMSKTAPWAKTLPNESYELMQPRLIYQVSALVLRLTGLFSFTLEQQVLVLRFLCVVMVLVAKVMVYKAISEIWHPAAVLATAYLAGMVPVDLLRFSNDTPATVLGAAIAWLLVLSVRRHRWRYTVGIMILLCAAAFTKLTALLFLGIVVAAVKVRFFNRSFLQRDLMHLLTIFVPAGLCTIAVVYANYRFSGSISGVPPASAVTAPAGWEWLQRMFSVLVWQWWHEAWLTIETMIEGRRGGEIYLVHVIVTWLVVGQALAAGWMLFYAKQERGPADDTPMECPPHLKLWMQAGLLGTMGVQLVVVLVVALVGQIWIASRMLAPVEMWPLMVACCGYVLTARQLKKRWHRQVLLVVMWGIVFFIWVVAAYAYLDFRNH